MNDWVLVLALALSRKLIWKALEPSWFFLLLSLSDIH
jgi:hypothetical protein